MNIVKKLQEMLYKSKVNFYKVNLNHKIDINYERYVEKRILIPYVDMDRIVKGVLTISLPQNIKGRFNKVLIISE